MNNESVRNNKLIQVEEMKKKMVEKCKKIILVEVIKKIHVNLEGNIEHDLI